MKIIRNNLIPPPGFKAINILGFLFVRKNAKLKESDITHESIHSAQIKELAFIGFYLWYLCEWIFRLCLNKFNTHTAYREISFEKEAYLNESNPQYLAQRKTFAFAKYLK